MEKKRTYFRPTTAQQRRLLFETWEATSNVSLACRKAHVSRKTFYNWKERFEQEGYAGLEKPKSHVPHQPHKTPVEVEEQVIQMRRAHEDWGKRRITDELAKANNWVPLVSPNTVRRILQDADLWPEPTEAVKKKRPKK
jgi:transposase